MTFHETLLGAGLWAGSCASVNQSEAWFPIDLCFQNTYSSKSLAHDPAPSLMFMKPKARSLKKIVQRLWN